MINTIQTLKPNNNRATVAMIVIGIIGIVTMISIIFKTINLFLWIQYSQAGVYSRSLADICEVFMSITYYLSIALFIISAYTFILWFRRAYYNLKFFTGPTEMGDGWAAGSWFIPIANWIIPYQIMKELYKKTDKYLLLSESEKYIESRLKISLVNWWWTLWIIITILGRITKKLFIDSTLVEDILLGNALDIFFSLLYSILCIVTIIVIKDYYEVEKLLLIPNNIESEDTPFSND